MGWIVLGIIVILAIYLIAVYNGLVVAAAAHQPGLRRHRRAAEAAPRPHSEPGRDREGLCRARARHPRSGDPGAQRGVAAQGPGQQALAENALSGALGQLFALAEAYPDLKANTNFQQLQTELSDIENKLSAARRFFNNAVSEYNASIQHSRRSLFSGMFGFGGASSSTLARTSRKQLDVAPQVKF